MLRSLLSKAQYLRNVWKLSPCHAGIYWKGCTWHFHICVSMCQTCIGTIQYKFQIHLCFSKTVINSPSFTLTCLLPLSLEGYEHVLVKFQIHLWFFQNRNKLLHSHMFIVSWKMVISKLSKKIKAAFDNETRAIYSSISSLYLSAM